MKFTKILVLLFLFIDFSVGFAQKKINVNIAHLKIKKNFALKQSLSISVYMYI
jgi:hypothetical protein